MAASSAADRAHRAAQALAGVGARRLMLAFSGRRDAGTIGSGPAGHWHCRRWSLRSWWRERPLDQPTVGIFPRRPIGKTRIDCGRLIRSLPTSVVVSHQLSPRFANVYGHCIELMAGRAAERMLLGR
jgi:hypothetical protein